MSIKTRTYQDIEVFASSIKTLWKIKPGTYKKPVQQVQLQTILIDVLLLMMKRPNSLVRTIFS